MIDENTWFRSTNPSFFEKFCSKVLQNGPIPKHVAIIMDGNRRYAKKKSLDKEIGYKLGFETILKAIKWCEIIGINEVTVYAFSIENFKRDKTEVDILMNLAYEKFQLLLEEKQEIIKNEVCFRFFGNLNFLPKRLQRLIGEIMLLSKNYNKSFINICIAYTSRHEIATAVDSLYLASKQGLLKPSDITEEIVGLCLYSKETSSPELLIRTSGEIRLSDFLLWQSNKSHLFFSNILWPECNFLDFFKIIFFYQKGCYKEIKSDYEFTKSTFNEVHTKLKIFIEYCHKKKLLKMIDDKNDHSKTIIFFE